MTTFLATFRGQNVKQNRATRTIIPSVSLGAGSLGESTWFKEIRNRLFSGGLTYLWGVIVSTTSTIRNFNWRQTDEEIDAQLGNVRQTLAGIAGGILGNALGWAVCGIVPGVVIARFNPALGAHVLKEVGEEALDELIGGLSALARYSAQALIRSWIYNSFKAGRKWLFNNPTPLKRRMANFFGIDYDSERELYLSKKSGHWTFAQRDRDRIEAIENPILRDFIEEAYEEFGEACIEAGFVVTSSIESFYSANQRTNGNILGAEKGVELQPDRTSDEKFILVGPQEVVKQQIINHLTQHQFIGNRDHGFITGESELVKQIPTSKKTLIINWRNFERPPWNRTGRGELHLRSRAIIEDLKNNITWEELKFAVKRFTTGDVRVTAFMSNGSQMSVLASTAEEGEDKLTELAQLTINEIVRFSSGKQRMVLVNRQPTTGARRRGNIRENVLMYPAFAFLVSKLRWVEGGTNQPDQPTGYSSLSDAYWLKRERFDIYLDNQPNNYPTLL